MLFNNLDFDYKTNKIETIGLADYLLVLNVESKDVKKELAKRLNKNVEDILSIELNLIYNYNNNEFNYTASYQTIEKEYTNIPIKLEDSEVEWLENYFIAELEPLKKDLDKKKSSKSPMITTILIAGLLFLAGFLWLKSLF